MLDIPLPVFELGGASSARRARPFPVVGAVATAMLAAALWRIHASFGHMMWLDELYATTLIDTPSLAHLWDGAVRGVDGNPPLYLSLAWALTRLVPAAPEQVLRPLNLLLFAATAVLLYRIGRRVASPAATTAALAVLPAVDGMAGYALTEVRTYALYLFLVAATLAAALRVVDRPRAGRTAALAGVGVLASLAHSFGGFYVLATLGAAGLACLAGRDRCAAAALGLAALPSVAALAAWIVVSYPAQKAVATPYGWISAPDLLTFVQALTGSLPLTPALALGAAAAAVRGRAAPFFAGRRDVAALCAVLAAYAGLTMAGWVGSQVITPFFVPRYFIPNLLIAALVLAMAAEAARRGARPALAAGGATLCVLIGLWSVAGDDVGGPIPCLDAGGRFIEAGAARDGLPIVAESPHAWMPRSRYVPNQTTLYPLDWRVVIGWPDRARNNAMDFHIMEILRDWAAPGTALNTEVLTTEDILSRYGRFLVLDEKGRAWFDEVRARTPMSAALIRENGNCRLWEVARSGGPDR